MFILTHDDLFYVCLVSTIPCTVQYHWRIALIKNHATIKIAFILNRPMNHFKEKRCHTLIVFVSN